MEPVVFFDVASVWDHQYPPLRMLVPSVPIPDTGVTLLCGRPKEGKSWFALQLAYAIASGVDLFAPHGGTAFPSRPAIYVDLENGLRRLLRRAHQLGPRPKPETFLVAAYDAKPGEERIARLEERIAAHHPAVVIIDTLEAFRPPSRPGYFLYSEDYAAVNELHLLALRTNTAIVAVHHTRKPKEEWGQWRYLDQVLGTRGITGAADTITVLDDRVLWVTGRDIDEEFEGKWAIERRGPLFKILGRPPEEAKRSPGRPRDDEWRTELREALQRYPDASIRELADLLQLPYATLYQRLRRLHRGEPRSDILGTEVE